MPKKYVSAKSMALSLVLKLSLVLVVATSVLAQTYTNCGPQSTAEGNGMTLYLDATCNSDGQPLYGDRYSQYGYDGSGVHMACYADGGGESAITTCTECTPGSEGCYEADPTPVAQKGKTLFEHLWAAVDWLTA
jgi:hypothetical protein